MARALLDSGSEGTFITERLQKRINLPTRPVDTHVCGINGTMSAKVRRVATFVLGSPVNPYIRIEARGLILPQLTGNLPQLSVDQAELGRLPPLELADVNFHTSQQVDMVIGADLYPDIIKGQIKKNILGSLLAQETVFGWVLTGPVPQSGTKVSCMSFFVEISSSQLTRFRELEQVPNKKTGNTARGVL